MSNIKPIETLYNGYRFRSRLEARWAVFFDAAGIKHEYEPEGFELPDGTKYLPDFYLPELRIFVEIKNQAAFEIHFENNTVYTKNGLECGNKYIEFARFATKELKSMFMIVFGDPYEAFGCAFNSKIHGKAFLFFDAICRLHEFANCGAKFTVEKHCGNKKRDCTQRTCKRCKKYNIGFSCHTEFFLLKDAVYALSGRIGDEFVSNHVDIIPNNPYKLKYYFGDVSMMIDPENIAGRMSIKAAHAFLDSALKARQARFEHGEKPII